MTGNVAPDSEKPAPVRTALAIVTGADPVEVNVSCCGLAAVFTATLPKATLAAPIFRVGTAAFNCSESVLVELPAVAVSVAV